MLNVEWQVIGIMIALGFLWILGLIVWFVKPAPSENRMNSK